jgi:hypothetical protein
MDITTILLTIQSLLDNNPLANEPGYEKISGNNLIYENYNKIIRYNTINSLIVDRINTEFIDFDIFKNTMIEYFKKNNLYINDTIEINKNIKENIKIGIYRIDISIDYEYLKIKYDKLNINLN